jgi:transcriptional regulator with XRE-family HTH domain
MTDLRQLLAMNIKARRSARGLSQFRLADRVDTTANYIAAIEAGRRFPSVEMLERIASALEIDTPELFSMEPIPAETIMRLQKDILRGIEKLVAEFISGKLRNLEKIAKPETR